MNPDVPWWIKFWWHGVDIAANVVATIASAGIVWLFARAFVRWRHSEQLAFAEKERQASAAFEERRAREASLNLELESIRLLVEKRNKLADASSKVDGSSAATFVQGELLTWLFSTGLRNCNLKFAVDVENAFKGFGNLDGKLEWLQEQIRLIRIPGEEKLPRS